MKSYLALTWKELKTQKITATLILIAVIMSTIITTVVGQSIGILQSMRIEQAASLNGNRYVTLTRYNDIGYASAMAVVFIVVLVVFTLVFMQSLWNPKKKNG